MPITFKGFPDLNQQDFNDNREDPSTLVGVIISADPDTQDRVYGSSGALPGFSGSPVFNMRGRVIGMCTDGPLLPIELRDL